MHGSDNYFEFSIAGAKYETKELSVADTKIYYVELCGERYTCSNTLKSKVQYRYVYANALSQQINGKHAYPHMKFSEIHNLWNLWNSDNWEDMKEVINTEQIYDKAINKTELRSLKFPIIMTDRKTYCYKEIGYLVHLDIALWDLYLQDVDRKEEILKELKYPPINEHQREIYELRNTYETEIELLKTTYEKELNDMRTQYESKLKELATALQIIKTIE